MRFLGARMWSSGNTSDYMLGADVKKEWKHKWGYDFDQEQ